MTQDLTQYRNVDQRTALLEPIRQSPPWLALSLGALATGLHPKIPEAFALTDLQRGTVSETCSRLELHLAPADVAEVAKCVAVLQAQFPGRETDDQSAAARAEGYLLALDGVPPFALREAVRLVLSGKAEGISPKWMPTSAQLRELADRLSLPARAYRVQLRRLLEAEVEPAVQAGPRALPPEMQALLGSVEPRRRGRGNPAGVDHSVPYRPAEDRL